MQYIGFPNTYPLDSYLSGGQCYPALNTETFCFPVWYCVIMALKVLENITEPSFKICTGKFSHIKGVRISLLLNILL